MDGENNGKPLLKWMIWRFFPYVWKHPFGEICFTFDRHLKQIQVKTASLPLKIGPTSPPKKETQKSTPFATNFFRFSGARFVCCLGVQVYLELPKLLLHFFGGKEIKGSPWFQRPFTLLVGLGSSFLGGKYTPEISQIDVPKNPYFQKNCLEPALNMAISGIYPNWKLTWH